jgi:membrane glycosyltransferase
MLNGRPPPDTSLRTAAILLGIIVLLQAISMLGGLMIWCQLPQSGMPLGAAEMALDAIEEEKEYALFAVGQLFEMVRDLREVFYGRPVFPKERTTGETSWSVGADRTGSATGNGWALRSNRLNKKHAH